MRPRDFQSQIVEVRADGRPGVFVLLERARFPRIAMKVITTLVLLGAALALGLWRGYW